MEIIVRSTIIYFFLFLVTRASGKRELSQMSAFEMILLIVMGDLVQQAVTQEDFSVMGGILAVSTIAFWLLLFSYISNRSKTARAATEGIPVVVARDGQPLSDVLRYEHVLLDELLGAARNHGIRDLEQVELAVLEPDGRFSFIKKRDSDSGDDGDDRRIVG